jgi:hypothetical protein
MEKNSSSRSRPGELFSNFDRQFEEGLKLIIAGIAAQKPAKGWRT